MEKKLNEFKSTRDETIFDFTGFEECTDFVKIMNLIKVHIKPIESNYQGITDMNGYFIKDDIYVHVDFSSMVGNCFRLDSDQSENSIAMTRKWACIIFDQLLKGSSL